MKSVSARLRGRAQYIGTGIVAAVAGAAVVAAVLNPGFKTADVNLNDGSVWVTNRSANLVGHLNVQSQVLDGGFDATTSEFDVLQEAANVFMDNDTGTVMAPVSVPEMQLKPQTQLGGSKQTAIGTKIVALSDRGAGKVWAATADTAGSFDEKGTKPIVEGVKNAAVAVGSDDTVYVADGVSGQVTAYKVDASARVISSQKLDFSGLSTNNELQMTVVGDKPVVLDAKSGALFMPGKNMGLDASSQPVLQQRSKTGTFVGISTSKGVIEQPLDGSPAKTLDMGGTGTPAAPIQQNNCVHAAWSGANKYVLFCGDSDNKIVDVPKASANSELVFRQNRDAVALNDVNNGTVWLVNQNMKIVNNWQDLKSRTISDPDKQKDSADPNFVNTLPDRTKPNRPPDVKPDDFGVRAGRTTVLPVLYNDSDPDGDVLTVKVAGDQPKLGRVEPVYGGTGLQITVPTGTTIKDADFNYTANDGRGGTATTSVHVRVVPDSENNPPKALRDTALVLEQGGTLTQNVLTDWRDPDGDDLYLVSATSDDNSAIIKTTPDGEMTYEDSSNEPGTKSVTLTVSDGFTSVQKKMKVSIKPTSSAPPAVNADFYRAVVGQTITLTPLKNDIDPSGNGLRLASISKAPNAEISQISSADNSVTFKSTQPGSAYLTYQATNGPQSSTGLIRVDVAQADTNSPPIAVKDLALLPVGGSTLVDVLGNDTDPAGGVLVVKSVTVGQGSPISATVLDHNTVKLTDVRGVTQNMRVTYEVANAVGTSTGTIDVLPIKPPEKVQPPVVKPDEVTVRAGDVVRIPVLDNDFDPNGKPLKNPTVVTAPPANRGQLFRDQDELRFIAGTIPGEVTGVYSVTSESGQTNSTSVTIHITPADPASNRAPTPKAIVGRAIAGSSTTIQIPLDGIDQDGDSVQLVGVDKAPTKGTAVIGSNYIQYLAPASSSGTDEFTYKVRDRLGAEATASIRVGIAPIGGVNHPPVANDDFVSMRPGRDVAVDVLLNDSDPDGDSLQIDPNKFESKADLKPRVSQQQRVIVSAPEQPGVYTLNYTINDGHGGTANANLRLTVTKDAPLQPPIARDDHVTEQETQGKTAVEVDALRNDEDPDGTTDDLKLTVQPGQPNASVTADKKVRVTLTDQPQRIAYDVTDVDGLKATALIWVPGLSGMYPYLKSNDHLQVQAGQSVQLNLDDYVKVRDGRSPRVTEADKVTLLGAPSENSVTNSGKTITFKADPKFYGTGSITFEVTDGNGPADQQGLKATLTVLVDVKIDPNNNVPPIFSGATLKVAKGETATLDLSTLAKDPNQGDTLKFDFDGDKPSDFDVSLDQKTLSVKVKGNVQPGSTTDLRMKVNDGHNPDVRANITLLAESTDKPLAVANTDVVPELAQGQSTTVPVLANDVNPFPDTPLTIYSVNSVAGVSASVVGDQVRVSADNNYNGTATLSYQIQDSTKDVNRRVTGQIIVNVKGKPEAPSAPRVAEVKSNTALLNWSPAGDNGSPITGYIVRNSQGGEQQCATNTCQITGLTNGTQYTFTVIAVNAIGRSDPSAASAPATPDRAPDAPGAPSATFGDGQVTLNWNTPSGDYTPVKAFDVEVSPAPAGQNARKSNVTGNSMVWSGLSNGTSYTFRVRAINNAKDPSDFSAYSTAVVPAGKPGAPGAPAVAKVADVQSNTNTIRVTWSPPNGNGDDNLKYMVKAMQGGTVVQEVGPITDTTQTFELPNSTTGYTFAVSSSNKAGDAGYGAASAPMRSVSKPGQVQNVTVTPTNTGGAGNQIQVDYAELSGNALQGSAPGEISYYASINGGSPVPVSHGSQFTASNGRQVSVTVFAKSSQYSASGDASRPATTTPYGQVKPVTNLTGNNGGEEQRTVSWTWNNPSDADVVKTEYQINGGGWVQTGGTSASASGDYNQVFTLVVRTTSSNGQTAQAGPVQAKAGPQKPPDPPKTQVRVQAGTWHSCSEPNGEYVDAKKICGGIKSKGGNTSNGGKWVDYADGWITVDRRGNPWGNGNDYYHMTDGRNAGRWVLADTVDVQGPAL